MRRVSNKIHGTVILCLVLILLCFNAYAQIDQQLGIETATFNRDRGIYMSVVKSGVSLNAQNIEFGVVEETATCNHRLCKVEIEVKNNDTRNMVFTSSDIGITLSEADYTIKTIESVEREYTICLPIGDECEQTTTGMEWVDVYKDINKEYIVTIPPGSSKKFYIEAVLPDADVNYKYDVWFNYEGETYIIDPYFVTVGTDFDNGEYDNTTLDVSGFVELDGTHVIGTYMTEIFDAGEEVRWDSLEWVQDVPDRYAELPNNGGSDSSVYYSNPIDMSSNVLLLHLNDVAEPLQDTSGSGWDGNNAGATLGVGGRFKQGAYFDGINDWVDGNDLVTGITDFPISFSIWINQTGRIPNTEYIAGITDLDVANSYYYILIRNTGQWCIYARDGVASNISCIPPPHPSNDNKWHMWTAVFHSDTDRRLYVDGVNVMNSTTSVSYNTGVDSYSIGARRNLGGVTGHFNGTLDEFALFTTNLTDAEVMNLYKRGVAKINTAIRSCDHPCCVGTNFTEISCESPAILDIEDNRYFQVKFTFLTNNQSISTELHNITINYTYTTRCNLDIENMKIKQVNLGWLTSTKITVADNDTGQEIVNAWCNARLYDSSNRSVVQEPDDYLRTGAYGEAFIEQYLNSKYLDDNEIYNLTVSCHCINLTNDWCVINGDKINFKQCQNSVNLIIDNDYREPEFSLFTVITFQMFFISFLAVLGFVFLQKFHKQNKEEHYNWKAYSLGCFCLSIIQIILSLYFLYLHESLGSKRDLLHTNWFLTTLVGSYLIIYILVDYFRERYNPKSR